MKFNYLIEKKRMLNSLGRIPYDATHISPCYGVNCKECPLDERNRNDGIEHHCEVFELEFPLVATGIVRKWANEHPRKTRKDVLLEKFPDAQLRRDGTPRSCAENLGMCQCAGTICAECWNTEVDE